MKPASLALCLSLCASPVWSADLEVIIDRNKDAIEVFVSLAATDIPAVFGNAADFIARPGEVVAYEALREGTWDQGDAMIAGAQMRVGNDAVALEAMSLMVHPKDAPMPFDTVADAYLAMSVCNGFAPGTVPTVDILHVYAGYIAYPVAEDGVLALELGNTDMVNVTVRDYRTGPLAGEERVELSPGAVLRIDPERAPEWPLWTYFAALAGAAGVVLAGCAAVALFGRHEKGRDTRPA